MYSPVSFVPVRSRVELAEMLDVPCVLYRNTLLRLQPCCARPGNVDNPVRAFPHGRELVESVPVEDPSEDKIASFKGPGAYVAAVVATQRLLILCCSEGGQAACFLEEEQVSFPQAVLAGLIEGQDPWGPVLELSREDRVCPIDEEEGSFAGRLGRCRADRP